VNAPRPVRPQTLRVRVARLTLRVRAPRGGLVLRPAPAQRLFSTARGADIDLTVVEGPGPRPARDHLLFESGGVWRVYRHGAGLLYQLRSRACDPPVYKVVTIDEDLTHGTLFFPRPRQGQLRFVLDFPLDELLFQHRLAREGHVELHACGLAVDGRAILFCGRSGAGKSTTARLWGRLRRDALVLSDDRIVVRSDSAGLSAHGTPWHGLAHAASPTARPLAAVFFLHQARRTRAERLAPARAAAQLFARSFPPPWDALGLSRVLDACAAIASGVPCFALRFRPDASAVEVVLDALGAARSRRAGDETGRDRA
jgi:hypothetical protein